ncbi:lipopolysaccharide assembly protein LapB [Hydrogenophaga sp. 5NK40-0174]|uniref:lipopolysaccharide assembly protein LapB n=1 Tax=Hydrogenophaga sp. 5NK40-0174 TaxID=3127649 RepID=UPI00310403A7
MDLDLTWLLYSLPIAFVLGWIASRLDLRQWRIAGRHAPKAYFRGLNHLLNEQQDQAIDAFIEAIQGDPETAELHFALGNLFRRRGDYDRAVRVHEHLLARADVDAKDRERAQHALALDFLKAGLLDRAEAALVRLEGTSFESDALLALLAIYERSRDWPQAIRVAEKLEASNQGSFIIRLAHYYCEEAELAEHQGETDKALGLIAKVTSLAPQMARGWIMLSHLRTRQGNAEGAYEALMRVRSQAPQALPLTAHPLTELAKQLGKEQTLREILAEDNQRSLSLDLTEALADLSGSQDDARAHYLAHLEKEPSLVMATRWLQGETLSDPQAQEKVLAALQHASSPLLRYRCAACGFEARQHFWQCPGCHGWDTYPARRVEEI